MKKIFLVFVCGFFLLPFGAFADDDREVFVEEISEQTVQRMTLDWGSELQSQLRKVRQKRTQLQKELKIVNQEEQRILKELGNNDKYEILECTTDYAPVCGAMNIKCFRAPCNRPLKTFPNKCEAGKKGIDVIYEGVCKTNYEGEIQIDNGGIEIKIEEEFIETIEKEEICTRLHAPVCGTLSPKCNKDKDDCVEAIMLRTFSNACEARKRNARILYKGACQITHEGEIKREEDIVIDTKEKPIETDKKMVCCESFGYGVEMKKCCQQYEMMPRNKCRVGAMIDGGGKNVVSNAYCMGSTPIEEDVIEEFLIPGGKKPYKLDPNRIIPEFKEVEQRDEVPIFKRQNKVLSTDQIKVKERAVKAESKLRRYWNIFRLRR